MPTIERLFEPTPDRTAVRLATMPATVRGSGSPRNKINSRSVRYSPGNGHIAATGLTATGWYGCTLALGRCAYGHARAPERASTRGRPPPTGNQPSYVT